MFACATFRGAVYGQLLYAGDDVSAAEWDHRDWNGQHSARERLLDLALAILLAIPLAPLALGIALAIWIVDGRPILHRSRRMRAPGKAFLLLKFRTLRPDASAIERVCGGDMRGRITRTGRILRRARLDELGCADEAELARRIRDGELDDDAERVRELVWASVRDKLSVANPKYLEP